MFVLDKGVNFVDMVEMYFVFLNVDIYGDIECIIGNWILWNELKCFDIVLMIKIVGSGLKYICNVGFIIVDVIVNVFIYLLECLKIDYIDVY